jgi:hypothetical protein
MDCAGDKLTSAASANGKLGNDHGEDESRVNGEHADGGGGRQVGLATCTHRDDSIRCDRGDNEEAE